MANNGNGNSLSPEQQRDLAARVLYESGLFSQADIGKLLHIHKKSVYRAIARDTGERKVNTRLTDRQVDEIKKLLAKAESLSNAERRQLGLTQVQIAAKFKVHQTTVSAIKREITPKYED